MYYMLTERKCLLCFAPKYMRCDGKIECSRLCMDIGRITQLLRWH